MSHDPPETEDCPSEKPDAEPSEEAAGPDPDRGPRPDEPSPDEGDAVRRRQQQFLGERAARLGPAEPADGEAVDHLRRMREYRRRQRHELEEERDEVAEPDEVDPDPEG